MTAKMKRLGNNPYMQGLKPASYLVIVVMAIFLIVISGYGVLNTISASLQMGNLALETFEGCQEAGYEGKQLEDCFAQKMK